MLGHPLGLDWVRCILRGLSVDDVPELESQLVWTVKNIHLGLEELYVRNRTFPSIQFALEQAFSHLQHGFHHFETPFSRGEQGQSINGLIWMGIEGFHARSNPMR